MVIAPAVRHSIDSRSIKLKCYAAHVFDSGF